MPFHRRSAPSAVTDLDLGFGSVVSAHERGRLLHRDGSFNVRRSGRGIRGLLNAYHVLLSTTWPRFVLLVVVAFTLTNLLFAAGFAALGDGALRGPPAGEFGGRFLRGFFFSVHTVSGVGYGHVTAVGLGANLLATLGSIAGLFLLALVTGLSFARFARPTAQIAFSEKALLAPYGDGLSLQFRIVNLRRSELLDVRARVLLACRTRPDAPDRRFVELPLERTHVAFFPLSWTIVHPIDAESPLAGRTLDDLSRCDTEVLVLLTGTDETFAATVHARSSYRPSDMLGNARFKRMFDLPDDGSPIHLDVSRLNDVEAV